MPLFSSVMAGMVTGLGGGIDYYERPHSHMQWGDEDFHPDTDWQDLFFGKFWSLVFFSTCTWGSTTKQSKMPVSSP
jgi:hypothetical protein